MQSIDLVGTLDLNSMLPVSKDYVTYAGSLTTPDCNEGLRWHVFDDALTITPEDQQKLQQKLATTFIPGDPDKKEAGYRANNQYVQLLNDRIVYHIGAPPDNMLSVYVLCSLHIAVTVCTPLRLLSCRCNSNVQFECCPHVRCLCTTEEW